MKAFIIILILLICPLANYDSYGQPVCDAPEVIHYLGNTGKYAKQNRKFTGIPSMAIASNGRMWATWYAGTTPGEDKNNYVVVSTSADGGNSWEEVLYIDPDGEGPLRSFDPQVWIAPDHSLWVFCAVGQGSTEDFIDTWFIKTNDPKDKNAVWSAPRFCAKGVMMGKPTVLSSGEWLFPVSNFTLAHDRRSEPMFDNSARTYISRDQGATFGLLGVCNLPVKARTFDEHMLVERKNGSLWLLSRTTYGIGESVSTDRGKTWSELQPSKIMHTSSRFFITRLASGNLLLVKNGPVDVLTDRSHLMAFLSLDDGLTWSRGLLLDQGGNVSYPDGQQTPDGRIHIIYDCNRIIDQLILTTHFTEADILDPHHDAAMIRVHNNRKVVSKGGISKQ